LQWARRLPPPPARPSSRPRVQAIPTAYPLRTGLAATARTVTIEVDAYARQIARRVRVANRLSSLLEHLKEVGRLSLAIVLAGSPLFAAAVPRGCTGSTSLGSFHLTVTPPGKAAPLPV